MIHRAGLIALGDMLSLPIYEQLVAHRLLANQVDCLFQVWGDQPNQVRPQIKIDQIESLYR